MVVLDSNVPEHAGLFSEIPGSELNNRRLDPDDNKDFSLDRNKMTLYMQLLNVHLSEPVVSSPNMVDSYLLLLLLLLLLLKSRL